MDARMVRVRLELDLIEGEHFNPDNKKLNEFALREEAKRSFISWLDSWCSNDTYGDLDDYVQTEIVYS